MNTRDLYTSCTKTELLELCELCEIILSNKNSKQEIIKRLLDYEEQHTYNTIQVTIDLSLYTQPSTQTIYTTESENLLHNTSILPATKDDISDLLPEYIPHEIENDTTSTKNITDVLESNKASPNFNDPTKEKISKPTILSATSWKYTKTFTSIGYKETQKKYYKKMNSCEEVLQLVDLDSKPFGSETEKIIKEIFLLSPRTSSQNDATRNQTKIEIKSARYWAGQDDCKWQHIEPDHDYDIVLFVLLDFQGLKVWGIKKTLLMGEMCDKKIVTKQGKQGMWVKKSDIIDYLTPLYTIEDLDHFIDS